MHSSGIMIEGISRGLGVMLLPHTDSLIYSLLTLQQLLYLGVELVHVLCHLLQTLDQN